MGDSFSTKSLHSVGLTTAFWMCAYEVTQKQWKAIIGSNPSKFQGIGSPRIASQLGRLPNLYQQAQNPLPRGSSPWVSIWSSE